MKATGPISHGKGYGYNVRGCRCDECRAWKSREMLRWRTQRNGQTSDLEPLPPPSKTFVTRMLEKQWERVGPWAKQGKCREHPPGTMFPHYTYEVKRALKICEGCPVKEECLDHAVRNGEVFGIWGGMSERARKRARVETKVYRLKDESETA